MHLLDLLRRYGLAGALAALSVVAYGPVVSGFFVSDDFVLLNGVRLAGPFGIWTFSTGFFRPLVSLSLYGDLTLWGLNPTALRLINLGLHATNALLVVVVAQQLLATFSPTHVANNPTSEAGTGQVWVSWLAGFIFAVLPAHAEAVAWISGRADLLATLFGLASLAACLAYARNRNRTWLIFGLAGLVAALASKENALVMPLIVTTVFAVRQALDRRARSAWHVPTISFLIVGVYGMLRWIFLGGLGGYAGTSLVSLNPNLWLASPLVYTARTIWPCCWPADVLANLLEPGPLLWVMRVFYLGLGLLCVGLFIWRFRRPLGALGGDLRSRLQAPDLNRRPLSDTLAPPALTQFGVAVTAMAAAVFTQAPTYTLSLQLETRIGERFLYLPSAFLCIALAMWLSTLGRRRAQWAAIALSGVYLVSTWRAASLWFQAGELAQRIVTSAQAITTEDTQYAVIVPDHLQGAFVFRNGFEDAAVLFGIQGQFSVITRVVQHQPDDAFSLTPIPGGLELRALSPYSRALTPGPVASADANVGLRAIALPPFDDPWLLTTNGRLRVWSPTVAPP